MGLIPSTEKKEKENGSMAQVVEWLLCKHK
jgi:hypothetical protein